jgi:Cell division protein CrgA
MVLGRNAVPKSQVRKKKVYTPPADIRPQSAAASKRPSPTWVPVTGVVLIVFAIAWLVGYYLTSQWWDLGSHFQFLAELNYWNLAIGFGAMVGSLVMLTRWR